MLCVQRVLCPGNFERKKSGRKDILSCDDLNMNTELDYDSEVQRNIVLLLVQLNFIKKQHLIQNKTP